MLLDWSWVYQCEFVVNMYILLFSQLCLTLCDPIDCSMPGFPTLHHLLESAQTHVHLVSDNIQQSHPLVFHFSWLLLLTSTFPASGSFQMSQFFASGGQSIGASASALGFAVNIQGWFLQHWALQWIFRVDFLKDWVVWSPCCSSDSQESSPAPQFENINSLALSLLHGPTLTSIHDYWKSHSFDYMDLCWQWCHGFLICCLGLL